MQWRRILVYYHHSFEEPCELSYCGRMEATLPLSAVLELEAGHRIALGMLDDDINVGAQILRKDIMRVCGMDLPIVGAMVVAETVMCDFGNLEWHVYANPDSTPGDMIMHCDGRARSLITTYCIRPDGHLYRNPEHACDRAESKKYKLH